MYDLSGSDSLAYSNWTDEDLLLEYRITGNRELFEELVERYEQRLFAFLRKYLGNAEDAEELFQQTFLMVHLKADQFEQGRRFRPWLYRIATNLAIDEQRRGNRRHVVSIDADSGGSEDSDPFGINQILAGSDPDPFEANVARERIEQVHEAVNSLPDALRQTLTLVYFQGMKYSEAAEVLGIPFGTVKSRLNNAFKKLNNILKDKDEE